MMGRAERLALAERFEMVQVQTVELLADLEEEHAETSTATSTSSARQTRRSSACRRWRSSPEKVRSPSTESPPPATSLAPRDHREEDSRITATAMPDGAARGGIGEREIGCARPKAKTTTTSPTSIVPEMFSSARCPSTPAGGG